MKRYKCQEMSQLGHELKMSPARLRLRQIAGIDRAIQLIDPAREYPYSFVAFQVTGYTSKRANATTEVPMRGKTLIDDLVSLAEDLTADQPLPYDTAFGRVYDAETLATRFNVSTKTISRWRKRGLLGCWFSREGERPRIGYTARSVRVFVGRNKDLIQRGSAFQLMADAERESIISRARELVATGETTLHAVTLKLAEETGRAVETVRYTLRNFDFDNPKQALFDKTENARKLDEKEVIYNAFMEGESLDALASRFNRTIPQIGRAITNCRLSELCGDPLSYIFNESFDQTGAEDAILNVSPESSNGSESAEEMASRVPAGLPAYLQSLYRTPLLTPEEERCYFQQMNYRMHRAERLRQKVAASPEQASTSDIAAVDAEIDMAVVIKKRITQANLRLVVNIAKRHLGGQPDSSLFELISDGNVALMRAVEKFDYAKGFKFSTYATWAIKRSFARSIPEEYSRRDRFRTGHDEFLAAARDYRAPTLSIEESAGNATQKAVAAGLAALSSRERKIVERHFGLSTTGTPDTLDAISRDIGISKERVRQIERRALAKLRDHLGDRGVELLAG